MTKMEFEEILKPMFLDFRSVITGIQYTEGINYKFSKIEQKSIDNFIDYFSSKTIRVNFIFTWYEIQFGYWLYRNRFERLKFGKRSINASMVLGKKAIERHENIKDRIFFVRRETLTFKKLFSSDILSKYKPQKSLSRFTELDVEEEFFKNQFFNSPKGLDWCISNTTLFNHKSKFCSKCEFKETCKELLKAEFYRVYKARKYDG